MVDCVFSQHRQGTGAARVHDHQVLFAQPFNLRQRGRTIEVIACRWRGTLPWVIQVVELLVLNVFPLQRLQHRKHIVHSKAKITHLLQQVIIGASFDGGCDGLDGIDHGARRHQRKTINALLTKGLSKGLPMPQHAYLDGVCDAPNVAAHFDDVEAEIKDAAFSAIAVNETGNFDLNCVAIGRVSARASIGLGALEV